MVEFGLKLEDNRVAEWGDYYVRYAKLKQILKKCQGQLKRFHDLSVKDPQLAETLHLRLLSGSLSPIASSASIQHDKSVHGPVTHELFGLSPTKVDIGLSLSEHGLHKPSYVETSTDESSSLLADGLGKEKKRTNYGAKVCDDGKHDESYSSTGSMDHSRISEVSLGGIDNSSDVRPPPHTLQRAESVGSNISHAIRKAASGVTEYFTNPQERKMKEALLLVARYSSEFERVLMKDIEMVNVFYSDKLKELEARLEFLKEAAAEMGLKRRHSMAGPSDDVHNRSDDEFGMNRRKYRSLRFAKSLIRFPLQLRASEKVDIGLDEYDDEYEDEDTLLPKDSKSLELKAKRLREGESIQRALVDQYRTAQLLHNYAILNFTGFVKIVKKHDKAVPEEGGKYKHAIRPSHICNEGKAVENHATCLEAIYAAWFCGGNQSQARAQLLPKKGDSLEMDWSQLRLGYRLGMCTILGLWVCWDCVWGVLSEGTTTIGERTAFPVFRACGGLLTLQWFWGISTWVWSRYRINYIYLFDFDPRIVASPLKIFNEAVDNTLVFFTSMLLYYKAGVHDIPGDKIPAGLFPFILVLYSLYQLLFPLRTRGPMWITIGQLVTSPLTSPSFFHGYVGDIFTSMVKVFQDLTWTVYFVLSGDWLIPEDSKDPNRHGWDTSFLYKYVLIPLVTLLPLWFRFSQCLRRYADSGDRVPHLPNAFKYALSQTVTLFRAFHPLYLDLNRNQESNVFQLFWMFAFVGSSLYSFVWDVYMDWGLGRPKHALLGPRLMYPQRGGYYAIIVIDFVLRFAWVLTLIPPDTGARFAIPYYLTAVSMVLELCRRTLWGFLRLENEHRSNTTGYRRVSFVPLHFATGHMHEYTQEKKHRGFSVLLEVAIITLLVIIVSFGSVFAAQHATKSSTLEL